MASEIWKDVKGYEGIYQASNLGRIRSLDRYVIREKSKPYFRKGQILIPQNKDNGYLKVNLWKNKQFKNRYVHRLVMESFCHRVDSNDLQVNHKDCDKTNNKLDNLEFVTYKQNIKHAIKNNRRPKGSECVKSKLTESEVLLIRSRLKLGEKGMKLAEEYNISFQLVSRIKRRKCWKHI